MPVTFWAMVIAGLSLAGIFPFAGFWSKDAIVASAYEEHYYVLFAMALMTVFLTAFYIFRAIFVAFTGEPRTEMARGATESPGIMTGPMVILAFLSVVSGLGRHPGGVRAPDQGLLRRVRGAERVRDRDAHLEEHAFSFAPGRRSRSPWRSRGIGLAYSLYAARPGAGRGARAAVLAACTRSWTRAGTSTRSTARRSCGPRGGSAGSARGFDRARSAGSSAGVGRGASGTGGILQRLQSGGVQSYALFILLSVLIIGMIVGAQYAFLMVALIAFITIAAVAVGARL